MRLGIDIGGTKVLGGLIDEQGRTHDRFRLASKAYATPQALAGAIGKSVSQLLRDNQLRLCDISHLGVGIPGTADWTTGHVIYSPNLFGKSVPLGDYLEEAIGLRPTIVQDSWAAAYAEYLWGQKKAYSDMVCVTLGTGVGCGIIQQGRVYSGILHTAGEIGHVSIDMNGRLCGCGRRGCLELYASGTGIYSQARERFPEKLTNKPLCAETVFELAYAGDEDALELIHESVDKLAFGLGTLINILACNNIFISGGLSAHEDLMIKPLSEAIVRYGYPAWSSRVRPLVQKAALRDEAPMIGAAFLTTDLII
ncbi:MAG: ROK family protein [Aristaeellaceae bacterium]